MPIPVSIFMPVFNARPFVAAAVESILAQTFGDFEFIIIDDGSTDGSLAVLQSYAHQDSRIRLITRPNRGIAATRNEGLAAARAPLIALLDADDVALPERLARQLAFMDHHPDVVAVGAQALLVDAVGDPIACWGGTRFSHEEIDRELLRGGWPIINSTHMMRTAVAQAVGGYRDFPTSEDHDLYLRLAEVGRLANLPETLAHYRVHLASNVHTRQSNAEAVLHTILRDAFRRRGLPEPREEELPRATVLSPLDGRRNWAWWALRAGNLQTARKHAWRAFFQSPASSHSWRLLYCTLRGH